MRKPIYAEIISKAILLLNKEFPGLPIGEHIALSLVGADIYNVTDKEFARLISEYVKELTELSDILQMDDNPDELNE